MNKRKIRDLDIAAICFSSAIILLIIFFSSSCAVQQNCCNELKKCEAYVDEAVNEVDKAIACLKRDCPDKEYQKYIDDAWMLASGALVCLDQSNPVTIVEVEITK